MKKFLLGILVGFIFALAAIVIVFFVMVRVASLPPGIPDGAVLVVRLDGSIPERPPITIPLPMFESAAPATVRDYWEMFRKAAADKRIRAVMLVPEGLSTGWAKAQELRAEIEAFQRSGKPVYAYLRAPRARDYYIASAADRVYMAPEDMLDLKGVRIELMYFKGTLDKLGVDVEVEHAGKYKDAPDVFTRTSSTPETREVMNSILDGIYGDLVETIARARRRTPEQIRAAIDSGPFLSTQAQAAGLIDGLKYQDDVYNELKARLRMGELKRVAHRDYMRVRPREAGLRTQSRIGLIAAEGTIVRDAGEGLFGNSDLLGAGEFTALLRRAGGDASLRGVIVRIDSPGGDSFASDEMWHEMQQLSRKKPVVISMSDSAASGGYYIAMTGDPIVAYPATLTGSIGVFYGKVNLRSFYDKIGVNKELMARGRFAAIDSDYVPLTEAGRKKLRETIGATYSTFLDRVAKGRHRPVEQIAPVAEGRVWLGAQACANGLVDEVGGLDRAIEALKRKARIPAGEQVSLVSYPPRRSLFEQLMSRRVDPYAGVPGVSTLRRFATAAWARGSLFYLSPYVVTVE